MSKKKNECKCDICGKELQDNDEKKKYAVCDDCRKALNSDRVEVGDDNGDT